VGIVVNNWHRGRFSPSNSVFFFRQQRCHCFTLAFSFKADIQGKTNGRSGTTFQQNKCSFINLKPSKKVAGIAFNYLKV
jgi:hypothetical protein